MIVYTRGEFIVLLLAFLATIAVGWKKHSTGVWVDDGYGHTVKAELPPGEAKVLRKNMLDVMGLPDRHRRRHIKTNGSAPIFLRKIYDALDERGHAHNLDAHYRASVGAADLIISFVNKNSKLDGRRGSHRRLLFDVSDVPLEVSLLGAELRIYRTMAFHRPHDEELALRIYLGCKEKSKEHVIAKGLLPKQGWMSFNITSAVLEWIIFPQNNYGLRIGVTRPDKKHELHLTEVGVLSGHDNENYRPFIVGFFAGLHERGLAHNDHHRTARSTRYKSDYINAYSKRTSGPYNFNDLRQDESRCQKRNMHVSFKDLGWQDWVIAPEGYNANFCKGRCQFPMLANTNSTNHAIIQTLVKMKKAFSGHDVPPEACCSPRDLTTISVLYIDYSNNVVLKKYPKMIVKTCGCV